MNMHFVFYKRYDIKGNLCAIPLDLHAVCWRWLSRWLASRAAVMIAAPHATISRMRPPPRRRMSSFPRFLPMKIAWCWFGKSRNQRRSRWWTTRFTVRASGWVWRAKIKTIFHRPNPILITSISGLPATAGSSQSTCVPLRSPTWSRIRNTHLRCVRSTPMAKSRRIAR